MIDRENAACIHCGLCREVCPVFTILRQEHISPRGLALLQRWSAASQDGITRDALVELNMDYLRLFGGLEQEMCLSETG